MSKYSRQLEAVKAQLETDGVSVEIIGTGAGAFVGATKGGRGVELYCGDETVACIDPAIGDELQGEIDFDSFETAVSAARQWLDGCDRDTLLRMSCG